MVKKKVDPRLRGLIEHGVRTNHRSMLLLVGDHGKDQVENIHKILSKTRVRARPSVLWCYKKELGFSTHRKKRMKEIKRNQSRGLHDPDVDDPFDLFISSTNIRWTYYKESEKILGQTFGMCVLQDFEAITPNLLARTIETVEGGGIIIILLKTVKSLKQLYTMTMDVHSRFRTEAHHEVVPRFNERFILSLGACHGCLVLDDELNILPISSTSDLIPTYEGGEGGEGLAEGEADASGYYLDPELTSLKSSLADTPHVGSLVELTKTIDQAKAVMSFLDAVSEKSLRSTVSLTAGRGRGKSAAIGICLAGAVSYGYSNIFVTAPSPENLKTVFEFLISGLKSLKYTEHLDFEVIQEHQGEMGKVVVRVNIFRHHRQTVQYILPSEHSRLAQAELVAIDEAAAIPLPIVKNLMGPYLVFMSSTINGYEGTGRSLSLKLLQQLRVQQGASVVAAASQAGNAVSGPKRSKGDRHLHEDRWKVSAEAAASYSSSGAGGSGGARVLTELTLTTPIRYSTDDPIEKWLNNLLCMEVASTSATRLLGVMPAPKDCDLYVVDRDALFSYHPLAESLLQRIWALYTAAHYKNSPNDLQMLSDAPAHRLFVLLGPQRAAPATNASGKTPAAPALPDVLCVVQVAFEGRISQKSIQSELSKGNKASGDLIPWTISQQFNDSEFATLSGARVVRIATHPDVQKMGYGSRAIDLLLAYFQGQLTVETLHPASGLFGGEGKGADPADMQAEASSGADLQGEVIKPKAKLPPLLTPITERPAELLHWFGTSFGLTAPLLTFWSRKGFKVCYLRQTRNELTGEHSAICLRELDPIGNAGTGRSKKGGAAAVLMDSGPAEGWLSAFVKDYRRRLISLMSYSFNSMEAPLAITLLDPDRCLTGSGVGRSTDSTADADDVVAPKVSTAAAAASHSEGVFRPVTAQELLSVHLSHHDMQRLELYSRNMVDHHMILDTLPTLTTLLFQGRLPEIHLSYLQVAIILATGLQHRDVDSIAVELNLPANQVLAFFNKTVRKISGYLRGLIEADAALSLPGAEQVNRIEKSLQGMHALTETLDQDQLKDEREFTTKQQQRDLIMSHKDLAKHAVKADLTHLEKALNDGMKKQLAVPKMISVPKGSVLPALSAEDLVDASVTVCAGEEQEGNKSTKKMKKERKDKEKRMREGEEEEESGDDVCAPAAAATTATVTPNSKQQQQKPEKAFTEKKKDQKSKKAKRESF